MGVFQGQWYTINKTTEQDINNNYRWKTQLVEGEPVGYFEVQLKSEARDYQDQIQWLVKTGLQPRISVSQGKRSNTGFYCLHLLYFQLDLSFFQTVKCLLIVPNPESALNEEAGKLLLEKYEDYSKRAQWWTDIHAKHNCTSKIESLDKADTVEATQGIKRANDKALDKKKKEKKRALKRLWQSFTQAANHFVKYFNI